MRSRSPTHRLATECQLRPCPNIPWRKYALSEHVCSPTTLTESEEAVIYLESNFWAVIAISNYPLAKNGG